MKPRAASGRAGWLLACVCVLAVGVWGRFHLLAWVEHNVDQAYPLGQALRTLDTGEWPVLGQQTSVLFANPAGTGYLFLPWVAAARHPFVPLAFAAASSVLAVAFAVGVGLRIGRAVVPGRARALALITGALVAANPWVIEYSRTTWVQAFLPVGAAALAWLLSGLIAGRARAAAGVVAPSAAGSVAGATAGVGIVFALLAGTYLLAYLLAAPIVLALALAVWADRAMRTRAALFGLLVGGGAVLVGLLVYVGALVADPAAGARLERFGAAPPRVSSEAFGHALRLATGADYAWARGTEWAADLDMRQAAERAVALVLTVAVAVGGGVCVLACTRASLARPARTAAAFALVWFAAPVALMSYVGQVVHPFYLLVTLPAGAVLAAVGVCSAAEGVSAVRRGRAKVPVGRAFRAAPGTGLSAMPGTGLSAMPGTGLSAMPGTRFRAAPGTGFRAAPRVLLSIMVSVFLSIMFSIMLSVFLSMMLLNSARYAQATAAAPFAHGLGALPVGLGAQIARESAAVSAVEAGTSGTEAGTEAGTSGTEAGTSGTEAGTSGTEAGTEAGTLTADADRWTLESLAGMRFARFFRQPDDGTAVHTRDGAPAAVSASALLIPREGGAYLAARPAGAPCPWAARAGGLLVLVRRWDTPGAAPETAPGVCLFRFAHGAETAAAALIGVRASQPDTPLVALERAAVEDGAVVLVWRVLAPPGDAQFAPFAHLFAADGTRTAVRDGALLPADAWLPGDRHLYVLAGVGDAARIEAGAYDAALGENIIFITADGAYRPSVVVAAGG